MARRKTKRMTTPLNRAHDRTHLYRPGELPKHAQIAAVDIEDPYADAGRVVEGELDVAARLEAFVHADGTPAGGAPGWAPPTRPKIRVVRSLKSDPLGRMHARGQIDEAAYLAARHYQELVEYAGICGSIRSLDPGRLVIDEGRRSADGVSDRQRHALTRLCCVDGNLALRHGVDALALVKAVLVDKIAIERVASMYGAKEGRQQRYWGWAFRRALDALATLLGYAGRARAAPSTAVDKWTLAAIGVAVRVAESAP
jgi:hypothetical protein